MTETDIPTLLAQRDNPQFEKMHTVAISGMGPVGMVAALRLAQMGHDVIIFEALGELSAEARASTFHPSSLELLEQLGVVEELHAVGLKAPIYQYRERSGAVLSQMDMTLLEGETKYPYRLQSEQNNLTQIILRKLEQMPNVTLRFNSGVARVERGDRHVRIHLEGGHRDEPVLAQWMIACDGAASPTRKSLGIAFEGTTYDDRFLVISTTHEYREDLGDDLAYVSYIYDPEEWGVLLRTPNHWRVLFPVTDAETDEEVMSAENMEARMQRLNPKDTPYEIVHRNVYAVNMRSASTYASGQVLLAGDAAHCNNPLGGMGMNSGIHDAWAAVECINAVLTENVDATHAASLYSELRRDAAINHVQARAQKNYDNMRQDDDAARAEQADQLSAMDRDLFEKREHQRNSAMFTSLRLTLGRLKRELHAVKAPAVSGGQKFSKLLSQGPVYAAGAYDAVSAKLVEQAGFKAVYVPGSAVSASVMGQPDLGYIGLAEMAEAVRRITAATDLPVVVDGDTGYGGVLQAGEAVRRLEQVGAAAVQFEDQLAPKRCGHLAGKALVETEEMVAKIKTAVAERTSAVIIARTDAKGVEGFEGALARATSYAEAGADMVFAEGVYSLDELSALRDAVRTVVGGRPLMVNLSEAGDSSELPPLELAHEAGVGFLIHPVSAVLAAAEGIAATYQRLLSTGASGKGQEDWKQFTTLLGQDDQLERAARLAAEQA